MSAQENVHVKEPRWFYWIAVQFFVLVDRASGSYEAAAFFLTPFVFLAVKAFLAKKRNGAFWMLWLSALVIFSFFFVLKNPFNMLPTANYYAVEVARLIGKNGYIATISAAIVISWLVFDWQIVKKPGIIINIVVCVGGLLAATMGPLRGGYTVALPYEYQLAFPSWVCFAAISALGFIASVPFVKKLDIWDEEEGRRKMEDGRRKNGRIAGALVSDEWLNQILMIVGTTGSGKTITTRHFYRRAIDMGYPIIAIDGKPEQKNIDWLSRECKKKGKPFYGFNCADYCKYDFLRSGGETELKDKIMSLKRWESDHYKTLSGAYLQTVFFLLKEKKTAYGLKDVIRLLDYSELLKETRELNNEDVMEEVKQQGETKIDELKGLQAHLKTLVSSELGKYLAGGEGSISLLDVIRGGGCMFFALPAMLYPDFSNLLGKLVISDLKSSIDKTNRTLFCIFDEFSVFAGEPVLNLINMGRSKGVHCVLGTQGLDDLARAGREFKGQILNCVNTMIIHRVNNPGNADELAAWIGTRESREVTHQIDYTYGQTGKGSVRKTREYIVHPDEIKNGLTTGEAYICSKCVSPPYIKKVKIPYIRDEEL